MPAVPPASAAHLPLAPILDPVARLSQRRRFVDPVQRLLAADATTREVGQRMNNCATRLALALELVDQGEAKALITGGMFCQTRLCPWCEWRRARVWRARLLQGLPRFAEAQPTHKAVMATFTVKNVPVDQLGQSLRHLHASWGRMVRCSFFPTKFWLRRTEITVGRPSYGDQLPVAPLPKCVARAVTHEPLEDAFSTPVNEHKYLGNQALWTHPHLHVLMLVPSSYFARSYVKQSEWQKQWAMAARLDYSPVVDIRRAYSKSADTLFRADALAAAIEAAKYISKSADIAKLGSLVPELHHQLRGARMIAASRPLSAYVRSTEPQAAELLDCEAATTSPHPLLHCVAQWDSAAGCFHLET